MFTSELYLISDSHSDLYVFYMMLLSFTKIIMMIIVPDECCYVLSCIKEEMGEKCT